MSVVRDDVAMATRERPEDRGRRRAADDLRILGLEVRRSRVAAGLSLRAVAGVAGVDHVQVWELESGRRSGLDIQHIGSLAAAVGLDVRLKAYPAGDPIRDAGQLRLLGRLRREIHPCLRWRTEVPLPIEGDLRAWDAMISAPAWTCAVEAETVLADLQAAERRLELKRRDDGDHDVILVVADTPRNRRALAAAPSAFTSLPGRTRDVLGRLRAGQRPRSGVVIL